MTLVLFFVLIGGGLGLLVVGSGRLVDAATVSARSLGVSELVLGLTIVAQRGSVSRAALRALRARTQGARSMDVNLRAPWLDVPALAASLRAAGTVKRNEEELSALTILLGLGEATDLEAREAAADLAHLALLSGGASALLADPAPGLTLEDVRLTTELLLVGHGPPSVTSSSRRRRSGRRSSRGSAGQGADSSSWAPTVTRGCARSSSARRPGACSTRTRSPSSSSTDARSAERLGPRRRRTPRRSGALAPAASAAARPHVVLTSKGRGAMVPST